MSNSAFSRRQFMAAASLSAAASRRAVGANERIGVAVIGCGGRGLLSECLEFGPGMNVEVAAVCDTWRQQREKAASVVKRKSLKTLNGRVSVRVRGGKVYVGGARVTTADVAASNGVIHVIDKVLLPR